jgi:hypothetical protein
MIRSVIQEALYPRGGAQGAKAAQFGGRELVVQGHCLVIGNS